MSASKVIRRVTYNDPRSRTGWRRRYVLTATADRVASESSGLEQQVSSSAS